MLFNDTTHYQDTFVAPANGWIMASGYGNNASDSYIHFKFSNLYLKQQASASEDISMIAPIQKGQSVFINMKLSKSNYGLYFVYNKNFD